MANRICKMISGNSCTLVHEKCVKLKSKTDCDYLGYYDLLTPISPQTPPVAKRAKQNLLGPFLQNFKRYAQNPLPGVKGTMAFPLEKEVRAILKSELEPLEVSVSESGRKVSIGWDVRIIADALVEKAGFPTSMFSVKTWIGEGQIRETFASAYFWKAWLGQKNSKSYMIGLQGIPTSLQSLVGLCKPYIDGIFSLSGAPYLDDLIVELKKIY